MSLLDEKHLNCPGEEELAAYARRELTGESYETVSLHLLFCDGCLGYFNLVSTDIHLQAEPGQEKEPSDFRVTMTPSLANAVERFLSRQSNRKEPAEKNWEQVEQEEGLKVGQIWRTKAEDIVLPCQDGKEILSVTQLDSAPHLVVITTAGADKTTYLNDEYHIIRVALVTADLDYAGAGDIVVPEADSPLGYALMIQLHSDQRMLRENLESCVGQFTEDAHQSILTQLEKQGQQEINEGDFALESVILKGLYRDPVMRYRAKEYEDTQYLRVPVLELLKSQEDVSSFWIGTDSYQVKSDKRNSTLYLVENLGFADFNKARNAALLDPAGNQARLILSKEDSPIMVDLAQFKELKKKQTENSVREVKIAASKPTLAGARETPSDEIVPMFVYQAGEVQLQVLSNSEGEVFVRFLT